MPSRSWPARRFWQTDRGLPVLLGSLVVTIFVVPLVRSHVAAAILVQVFFGIILVSGLGATTRHRATRVFGTATFAAAIGLFWADHFRPGMGLYVWTPLARIGVLVLLIGLVVRQVFREGPITLQRIQGAVAVYMLLGLMWQALYEAICAVWPDAFRFSQEPATQQDLTASLAYYSFVTLTTMGYGDIAPVHPAARSAAILEALTGQLFPAILIARLVGMELAGDERRR